MRGRVVPAVVVVMLAWAAVASAQPQPFRPSEGQMEMVRALATAPEIVPIPLRTADGRRSGDLYDATAVWALRLRVVLAEGRDPVSAFSGPPMMIVIGHALTCDGRTTAPSDIRFTRPTGEPPRPMSDVRPPSEAAMLLPGVTLGETDALRVFQPGQLDQLTAVLAYPADACDGPAVVTELPIVAAQAVPTTPFVQWLPFPEGTRGVLSPSWVNVQAWVDTEGQTRFAAPAAGPDALAAAAVAYVDSLEFSPWKVNDMPLAMQLNFRVGFTRNGEAPPATATSNSRSAQESVTQPAPELATSGSRCRVSDDPTYGYDTKNPIRVGGEPRVGAARQRAFLLNLRGPAGEPVRFRRLGAVPLGVNGSEGILDLYVVIHDDMDDSRQIYMDVYSSGDLAAPAGFACAAPINIGG